MKQIRQIMIGGHRIGLVGLDEAFERIRSQEFAGDEGLAGALLDLVAATNYIPESSRDAYKQALLREYRIARGDTVEEVAGHETRADLEVRVYGPGCANCERLAAETISALAALGLDADFEHVRDIDRVAAIGQVGLPALAIDGKIVAAGRVPSRERIIELLREATE
jgi:small redox-active disulfide protein 2